MTATLRRYWLSVTGHYVRESERAYGASLAEAFRIGCPVVMEQVGRRWQFRVRYSFLPDHVSGPMSIGMAHRIAMAVSEAAR